MQFWRGGQLVCFVGGIPQLAAVLVEEAPAWFGKGTGWRVRSGIYCCSNAFSRVDMRVDVKIPGGVEAYIVDLRGER